MLYKLVRVPAAEINNGAYQGSPSLKTQADDGWELLSIAVDPEDGTIVCAMSRDD